MAYKVTPLSLPSPGRLAGVGGERTGQKQPLLPLLHNTPKAGKTAWAKAQAGQGHTQVLSLPLPAFFFGEDTAGFMLFLAQSVRWILPSENNLLSNFLSWIKEEDCLGLVLLVPNAFLVTSNGSDYHRAQLFKFSNKKQTLRRGHVAVFCERGLRAGSAES